MICNNARSPWNPTTLRLNASSPLLICEHCDSVYRRPGLSRGESSRCVRCDAVLKRREWLELDGLQAMALAGSILFVIANSWPILSLGLGGQREATTLWGMAVFMWNDGYPIIASITVITLLIIPFLRMAGIFWLLTWARRGRRAPLFVGLMVILARIKPWAMVEVFVLGVLVAIVKSKAYYEVETGAGMFAYGALTILATVASSADLRGLWDQDLHSGAGELDGTSA